MFQGGGWRLEGASGLQCIPVSDEFANVQQDVLYKSKGSLCRPVPRGPAYVDQAYFLI